MDSCDKINELNNSILRMFGIPTDGRHIIGFKLELGYDIYPKITIEERIEKLSFETIYEVTKIKEEIK